MNTVPHVWVTAEGLSIAISKMSDSHLDNTIALLERRGWTQNPKYPQYPRLLREREARILCAKANVPRE